MVSEAFANLIGQKQAVALLERAVAQKRLAPAYLFAGPEGIGRSLTAKAFIELLFCLDTSPQEQASIQKRLRQANHPDVLWVEPTYLHNGKLLSVREAVQKGLQRKTPPQIRLEQIREIGKFLACSPLEAKRKVVVLEKAETMAEPAANGLLKTLEEPGLATLILIAPSTESLLATLISRCQRIPFSRLARSEMEDVLKQTGHQEILQESLLLEIAQGSPGEAIASFAQLKAISPELLNQLVKLPKTLRKALELAKEIDKTLDAQTQLWLLDYLEHSYWRTFAEPSILQKLEKARKYLLGYAQARLVWEVTLLELCQR
ncbi:MAG: DNA polymerase III subunit delta' [Coleofasciculaceae cyanobacterium]